MEICEIEAMGKTLHIDAAKINAVVACVCAKERTLREERMVAGDRIDLERAMQRVLIDSRGHYDEIVNTADLLLRFLNRVAQMAAVFEMREKIRAEQAPTPEAVAPLAWRPRPGL
jgi:hypothetical protein